MKRFAVTEFGRPLCTLVEDDPVPQGSEVMLDLERCGVCHTDLHLREGHYDLGGGRRLSLAERGVKPPVTLGHEILGRIAAAGPEAGTVGIGRRVLVFPWIGCGSCHRCLSGEENLCAAGRCLGVHRPGGFAEKVVVPHPRYLIDVEDLEPSSAATLACSGLTAFSALRKVGVDPARDWLLLIGAGGLGQSALRLARALGHTRIAVADTAPGKRARSLSLGADLVLDPVDPGARTALLGLENGLAAAIDFVGNAETARFAIDTLRRGGRSITVGMFGGEISLPLPLLPLRALTLTGSYVGNLGELRDLVDLVRRHGLTLVETETIPLDQAEAAMRRLEAGSVAGRLVLSNKI
ncbi:alcohol dehydrogenase catalytic domain-containing protein [Methylobacterium sp. SyP6R]|uniref:alcohol dehydrogenase catalytic domain-containing protein n=1 Tax=Methylobacterium sp. SyP6R TaxID=2718876 RepID=UPI001F28935B|nr:alcohol dehydrogenase catalytic domain-containing protein [Methylobacterium sp. SyP6R]MCF4129659.1 alcohol dehydrogenase catalytic domain-containing protein [Methylobacterium sp. SyP6R]